MPEDTERSEQPADPRASEQAGRRTPAGRPPWWPLAAIGGGLASAVLAGAAWSATAAPTTVAHRTARGSESATEALATRADLTSSPARAGYAALAAVGSGSVDQVVSGPGGAAGIGYVVQVSPSSGPKVHVIVDDSFTVRSVRVGSQD
ncbi:MAG TPA: hypothetical protein VIC82_01400 [Candidatus Nanopelagicales bacterium]